MAAADKIKLWGDNAKGKLKFTELIAYPAPKTNNTGTAVIICPGGSYCYLGMKGEGYQVAKWLNRSGINAFVLRYRIGMMDCHHPDMIQDVLQAILYVREHADDYGVDKHKTGVMGFSAGGHLAGSAAIYFDSPLLPEHNPARSLRPDFAAMIYPVVTMSDPYAHHRSRWGLLGSRKKEEAMRDSMSLEKHVRKDMPPVFIVACKDDEVVDYHNSLLLYDAMQRQALPCELHLFDKGGHGFGASDDKAGKEASAWKSAFLNWLQLIR
jgi:acetyl esterase/lipase